MTKSILCAGAALASMMMAPTAASAQWGGYGGGYGNAYGSVDETSGACDTTRRGRATSGALIGGVLGGLLGSGIAADGVEGEGAALGAVVGALAGAGVGQNSVDCGQVYGDRGFGGGQVHQVGQVYGGTYGQPYQTTPYPPQPVYDDGLYGGPAPVHSSAPTPAARQCETVYSTTRLPDGTIIKKPVEACREAYYGDWSTH